jgi:hypothetical protein
VAQGQVVEHLLKTLCSVLNTAPPQKEKYDREKKYITTILKGSCLVNDFVLKSEECLSYCLFCYMECIQIIVDK